MTKRASDKVLTVPEEQTSADIDEMEQAEKNDEAEVVAEEAPVEQTEPEPQEIAEAGKTYVVR